MLKEEPSRRYERLRLLLYCPSKYQGSGVMNRSVPYKPLQTVLVLPKVNKDVIAGKASHPKTVRAV